MKCCRIAAGRFPGLCLLHVALASIFFKSSGKHHHAVSALSVSASTRHRHTHAASKGKGKKKSTQTQSLNNALQKCFTPKSILEDVGRYVTPNLDPQGTLSSLILIRLSKHLVNLENTREFGSGDGDNGDDDNSNNNNNRGGNKDHNIVHLDILSNVLNTLASAGWESSNRSLEAAVEGTKAASVLSRLLKEDAGTDTWEPLIRQWHNRADDITAARLLEPHHLSGLKWSMDCFQLLDDDGGGDGISCLPLSIQNKYEALNLPFRLQPDFLGNLNKLSVTGLRDEVDFQSESIRTTSNRVVKERRQTAWQGDEHVNPFAYSGKSMARKSFSPVVLSVRDQLSQRTSQHYDGCLLNLYPDGGSGMRYHSDPDQGSLWGYETVVASVGATRKFAFRPIANEGEIGGGSNQDCSMHVFTLMHGDLTEMFGECQARFQHTVKNADVKDEKAARASLVFKKTLTN